MTTPLDTTAKPHVESVCRTKLMDELVNAYQSDANLPNKCTTGTRHKLYTDKDGATYFKEGKGTACKVVVLTGKYAVTYRCTAAARSSM